MQAPFEAWNKFVMQVDPRRYAHGSIYRAAAVANLFMALANNGGLLHTLEAMHELDADEVVRSLSVLGAHKAAAQLQHVMLQLEVPLPPMSQSERWDCIRAHSSDEIDDCISEASDAELLAALETHVAQYEAFYLGMTQRV